MRRLLGTSPALAKATDLLDGATIDSVASWADDYRRDHQETGRWHYIDIPLPESKIDMAGECPDGQCDRSDGALFDGSEGPEG